MLIILHCECKSIQLMKVKLKFKKYIYINEGKYFLLYFLYQDFVNYKIKCSTIRNVSQLYPNSENFTRKKNGFFSSVMCDLMFFVLKSIVISMPLKMIQLALL